MTTYFYSNRQLLVLSLIVIVVAGLSALNGLPRVEDPRIRNRNPLVVTTLPGANAARVESLITKPLETALRDLHEIKNIESQSRGNVSFIQLELDDSIYETESVYTKIRDKISDVRGELPPQASLPHFDEQRGALAYTLILGVKFPNHSPTQELGLQNLSLLNRTAEELADRMRNLPGTDLVRIFGQPQEEITIELNRNRLTELGLAPAQVANRIADADSKVAAGMLRSAHSDHVIEVSGSFESVQRINSIPIARGSSGETVLIGDIADIHSGWQDPPQEIAFANHDRSILVAIRMLETQQIASWMEQANLTLQQFEKLIADDIQIDTVFNQRKYTEERLGDLGINLLLGSLVVVAVVFVLMGWRSGILVGLALPVVSSLVMFSLQWLEVPLHQMSIFGLIVAIGLLIDNAIVVVDDVTHRIAAGNAPLKAVDSTVRHLFVPLLGSTITTVLSFLPIFLLPGNVGEFVGSIATTVILALVFSFLISMSLIPALAGIFASTKRQNGFWNRGVSSSWFSRRFSVLLQWLVQRPVLGIMFAVAIPLIGFLRVSELRNQFFPGADRNQFQIQIWTPPQSSIKSTAKITHRIDEWIQLDHRVDRVDWIVGGSMPTVYYNLVMNQDNQPSYAHGIVTTKSKNDATAMITPLQLQLDDLAPGSQVVVRQLSQGPPVVAPIEIRVYGPSIDRLKQMGQEIQRLLYETPGVIQTRTTFDISRSKIMITADEAEAELSGLSLNAIATQLQTNLEGATGGLLLESTEQLPVRLRLANRIRGDLNEIASTRLQLGAASTWMPLEAIAKINITPEEASIPRRNGQRCNTIQAFVVADALPPEVTSQFLKRLVDANFQLPDGYRLQVGGDAEELKNSMANLLAYAPILGVLIIATLILSFRSFVLAGIIGAVAGLSAGITFFTIWISGFPLGFNPLIGMAGLVGLAINDSIVVLTQIRSNPRARNGDNEAIVSEVLKTGRHVISTTLTTIGGFLPLLVSGGTFWPPLAVVIAGGVGGATILAIILVPCAYRIARLWGDIDSNMASTRSIQPESSNQIMGFTHSAPM